jgi:hypothetical protein
LPDVIYPLKSAVHIKLVESYKQRSDAESMKISMNLFKTDLKNLRFIILIVFFVLIAGTLLAFYNLKRFETFSTFNLQHEGILLADALKASIAISVEKSDIQEIQSVIDRFSALRGKDIELNVIFLGEEGSSIVASNIKGNIEETSDEEHENLLKSLKHKTPVVFIGDESKELKDDDDPDEITLLDKGRFLSITVPLTLSEKDVGSINAKLSLIPVDEKIGAIRFSIQIATTLQITLLLAGLAFLIRQFVAERYKTLEAESLRFQMELKTLQSQINPHFLFNTLNSLSSLIPDNPELAEDLTIELADLFRKVLSASKKGWWLITDEVELIKSYLNIEKARLQGKLQFSIESLDTVQNIKIPCLIIEPLVENAIKHGINSMISGGSIRVGIVEKNDLIITVEDTLTLSEVFPRSQDHNSEKVGIQNIKNRLKLIYGENAKLTLIQSDTGATAAIKIKDPRKERDGWI